ncbi:MAG TPA: hypothetical protein VGD59_14625 [Acidisarcina sp.]
MTADDPNTRRSPQGLCRGSKAIGLALLVSLTSLSGLTTPSKAATPESAPDLARDVFYNEVQDRETGTAWEYRLERKTPSITMVAEQIETRQGPIHRMLMRDGLPLTSVQEREENARLDQLLQSPSDQARVQQKYEEDEARLQRLMKLMPDAFLFEYDGPQSSEIVRLRYQPNPGFKPPTFEARIFHELTGTLTINRRYKRLIHMQGELMERVDFGWGLLGHVEKGGVFEIDRRPVNATHWKTDLVDVHMQGKLVLFKTVAQNQREVRSAFKQVPSDITLAQARIILNRVGRETAAEQTRHGSAR